MNAVIQQIEEYWDRRPCNVRHGEALIGSFEWSQQVSERKYRVEPHIRRFASFPRWHGKDVLEIGCGIGTDTLEFLAAGAHVDAVDLSNESLDLARARTQMEGYGSEVVRFFHANAETYLPGGSNWYDLVYSFGVLHHTPEPGAVLVNARKRLKMDGELRLMLYATWSLKFLLREQPEAQAGCPVVRTYSAEEAALLLSRSGFIVERITKTHIFPWRVADYVEHRYVKRLPYRYISDRAFHWLEGQLGHHLLIVARRAF